MKEQALRKLQQLSEAYHVLKDDNLRRYYDDWCMKRRQEIEQKESIERNRVLRIDSYIPQDKEGELFVEGMSLLEEGKITEAVTRFRMALHVAPNFQAARFFLGRSLLRLGGEQAPEGRKIMQEAIQKDSTLAIFMHEAQPQMDEFEAIDRDSLEFEEVPIPDPEPEKPKPWWRFGQ